MMALSNFISSSVQKPSLCPACDVLLGLLRILGVWGESTRSTQIIFESRISDGSLVNC